MLHQEISKRTAEGEAGIGTGRVGYAAQTRVVSAKAEVPQLVPIRVKAVSEIISRGEENSIAGIDILPGIDCELRALPSSAKTRLKIRERRHLVVAARYIDIHYRGVYEENKWQEYSA